MNNIKISIITPSYNQGKFIEKTIQSVLNQTYENFEYIIFDSCSNDETHEILEKYKNNPKIKIFIEKDKGQTDAINKGFKVATGELVGWINSDDLLKSDCLENIVKEYNEETNISLLYGNLDLIDMDGKLIKSCDTVDNISYKSLLFKNPQVVQPGSFYKASYVREIGYADILLNFVMDYDLWIRLLEKGKAVKINKVLAEFRLHNDSKTMGSGNSKKFWKEIYFIRKNKYNINQITKFDLYFIRWLARAIFNKLKLTLKQIRGK